MLFKDILERVSVKQGVKNASRSKLSTAPRPGPNNGTRTPGASGRSQVASSRDLRGTTSTSTMNAPAATATTSTLNLHDPTIVATKLALREPFYTLKIICKFSLAKSLYSYTIRIQ